MLMVWEGFGCVEGGHTAEVWVVLVVYLVVTRQRFGSVGLAVVTRHAFCCDNGVGHTTEILLC